MKYLRCDLHLHTNYSFDSSVAMEQYVTRAVKLGFDAICFTDHIDVNRHYNTFDGFMFEQRQREYEQLRRQYEGTIKLLIGFEVGEPHLHPEVMDKLYSLQPDMIIGSVHYPLDYGEFENVNRREYERIYDRCVRQMVEHGGFDVLGHMDMPKKYHADFLEDFDYVCQTLGLCAQKGIVPEINTSSIRNGADTMPSVKAIEYYAKCGGKYVTVNSDSHSVETLGYAHDETVVQLPKGIATCYFEKRQIIAD